MKQVKKKAASSNSTANRVPNAPHKHILSWLKHAVLRCLCQDEEIHMTMQWKKISFILKTEGEPGIQKPSMEETKDSM